MQPWNHETQSVINLGHEFKWIAENVNGVRIKRKKFTTTVESYTYSLFHKFPRNPWWSPELHNQLICPWNSPLKSELLAISASKLCFAASLGRVCAKFFECERFLQANCPRNTWKRPIRTIQTLFVIRLNVWFYLIYIR